MVSSKEMNASSLPILHEISVTRKHISDIEMNQ